MINSYSKKPVVIQAVQWTGWNGQEIADWMGNADINLDNPLKPVLVIHTLEGDMRAQPTDWIIRGIKGEFYPCRIDIFESTYELVEIQL